MSLNHLKIGVFFSLFLLSLSGNSQTESSSNLGKKNEIRLQYHFGYTKTNFDETLEPWTALPSASFLESNPPIYPILGWSFGGSYGRQIFQKNKISIFFNRSKKGQKSDIFYNYFGFPDTTNIREQYGGVSYQFTYFSNEFGLEVSQQLFEKKELNLISNLNFRLSADVYDELIFRNFILNRQTGLHSHGCCLTVLFHSDSNKIKRFYKNLQNQYFRIGLGLSMDFDFHLIKNLALSFRPQIQYYSKIVASSEDPNIKSQIIKNGTIYTAQLGMGVTYKF